MLCPNCQHEITENSKFCYFCGARQEPAGAKPSGQARRLVRPYERMFGGVCAGFANYLDVDVTLLRVIWVLVVIFTGIFPGVVAYLVAWMVIPEGSATQATAEADSGRRLYRSVKDRKLGGVCGGLAEYLDADPTIIRLVWALLTIFPGAIVCGLLAYLVAWIVIPEAPVARTAAAESHSSPAAQHS